VQQAIVLASETNARTAKAKHIGPVLRDVWKAVDARTNGEIGITGYPTTFAQFDGVTGGLQPSELYVIGGRPSMGKTAWLLNVIRRSAVKQNLTWLFFSLEMAASSVASRLVSSESEVEQNSLRTGNLADGEWTRMHSGIVRLAGSPIWIDDTSGLTTSDIRSRACAWRRTEAKEQQHVAIAVDYLGLINAGPQRKNVGLNVIVGDIAKSLKELAKDLACPVLVLCQLNRGVEGRPDKRPTMADLRDSGNIEEHADFIALLYRADYYNRDPDAKPDGLAQLIVEKNRNGETPTIDMKWDPGIQRFEETRIDRKA
jgi:replicative DNA helicase